MDIGKVAKLSGLPPSTLRFYEEKNLIKSIGRKGLRRVFDSNVMDILALILLGRNAGFSLDEIAAMFTPDGPKIDRNQLMAKADQLDQKIKQLAGMRDSLRHAANCPASNHFECPTFQRLLTITTKNQRRNNNQARV